MPVPKYQMIVDTLCAELDSKLFHQGDPFYSEADIKNRFNVSSTTAVKALNILASFNKITRIQGKGTFVSKENHDAPVTYTDLNMANGKAESTKVLSVALKNNTQILKKLYLPKGANYFEVKRLRYIDRKIVQYTISYVIPDFIDVNKLHDLTSFSSLYQRIHDDFDLNPYTLPYSQQTTARIVSEPEVLQHFQTNENLALIIQERQTFLPEKNRVLDYVISYKLPEYWGFKIQTTP